MHGQDLEAERAWQMKSSDELPPLPPGAVGKGLDGYGLLKLETSWTEHIVRSLTSQVVVGHSFWIGFEIPWKGSGEFFSKMRNKSEFFLGFQSIDCGGSLMAGGRLLVHCSCDLFFFEMINSVGTASGFVMTPCDLGKMSRMPSSTTNPTN